MDRNTIIGLVLIMGLVLTWSFFFSDTEPVQNPPQNNSGQVVADDTANVDTNAAVGIVDTNALALPDSVKDSILESQLADRFGWFSRAANGTNESISVKTDKLSLNLATKGATVRNLTLGDEYQTYQGGPLKMEAEDQDNRFAIIFATKGDRIRTIESDKLYFETDAPSGITLTGSDSAKVNLRAHVDQNRYLEFAYTFYGDKYDYDFNINFVGIDDAEILKSKSYTMKWVSHIPQSEKSVVESRKKTSIYYLTSADDLESLSPSDEKQTLDESEIVEWVAFKDQFFTTTLISEDRTRPIGAFKPVMTTPPNEAYSRRMEATMSMEVAGGNFHVYAGPLDYDLLEVFDRDMEFQIELGRWFLKYINIWVTIPVFKFLEDHVGNYGLIILILALLIKLVVFPMTYKTYISGAKMRVVNDMPEVKALDEKFKDDPTKLQQEKLGLYRKLGVSPFGGCLPALLQYPILISMFFFFPNSIELRGEGFLWVDDLSSFDSIYDFPDGISIPGYGDHISLFTLLMAASLMIYTLINQKSQGQMAANPMMKYMPFIFPVFLLIFLNNYSAGLCYYYFLQNIISIGQTSLTRLFIDDEKLLDKIHEEAKKKSKSGKKGRMEAWLEKQQKKQREMQKEMSAAKQKGRKGRRAGKK